jgi:hypothetical protein
LPTAGPEIQVLGSLILVLCPMVWCKRTDEGTEIVWMDASGALVPP